MSDERKYTMVFSDTELQIIQQALHHEGGEVAASEMRRTGGYGFASSGVERRVDHIRKLRNRIREESGAWDHLKTR